MTLVRAGSWERPGVGYCRPSFPSSLTFIHTEVQSIYTLQKGLQGQDGGIKGEIRVCLSIPFNMQTNCFFFLKCHENKISRVAFLSIC